MLHRKTCESLYKNVSETCTESLILKAVPSVYSTNDRNTTIVCSASINLVGNVYDKKSGNTIPLTVTCRNCLKC